MDRLLATHGGGSAYFNALDELIRTPAYFELVYQRLVADYPRIRRYVLTGAFGDAFDSWLKDRDHSYRAITPLVLPGGLRKLPPNTPFPKLDWLDGREYLFVDDSLWGARTFRTAQRIVRTFGGELNEGLVIYDGSAGTPGIRALYSYRQHMEMTRAETQPNV